MNYQSTISTATLLCLFISGSIFASVFAQETTDAPAPKTVEDNTLIHSAIPLPAVTQPAKPPAKPAQPIDLSVRHREIPTITYGVPPWAMARPTRKLATTTPTPATPNQVQPLIPKAEVKGVELEQRPAEPQTVLNFRIVVPHNTNAVDVVYVYPYPVKLPPLSGQMNPLPTNPGELKGMILGAGYSDRIDFNRPYPAYGWRWVHSFYRAHAKSGLGWPHTMLTMYPWVDKMLPYVMAEVKHSNSEESERLGRYVKAGEEYESTHVERENEATLKGLVPIAVKMNSRGIGQTKLFPGNWWVTATRKVPGLKMFWEIPITCRPDQTINVQFTEANALTIQGGW
ncbi:MAG: hypothetical protein K2W82_19100 [Candidatus Obscuribacterales bacterium]|nr:hypothetical protein [Candidatus Obscuribacterales bacterium]